MSISQNAVRIFDQYSKFFFGPFAMCVDLIVSFPRLGGRAKCYAAIGIILIISIPLTVALAGVTQFGNRKLFAVTVLFATIFTMVPASLARLGRKRHMRTAVFVIFVESLLFVALLLDLIVRVEPGAINTIIWALVVVGCPDLFARSIALLMYIISAFGLGENIYQQP